MWLIKQYLIVAGIGAIAIAFRFLFFGGIFFSGAIVGYIANCVVVLSQQGKTTMKGGFYNVIIIVFAVIVGIVFEIVIRGEYRRAIEKNTSENMSEPNGD